MRQTFLIGDKMLDRYVGHVLAECIAISEDAVDCHKRKLVHDHRAVLCSYCLYIPTRPQTVYIVKISQLGQLSLSSFRGRQMSSELQLDVCHLNQWRRHLVNAYEVKGRYGVYCR